MPNLSIYKKVLQEQGKTNGQVRKNQSDMIMENTWWEDIQSRVVYLYDAYHEDENEMFKLRDLHPEQCKTKIPIDAKYIISTYQTLDKDQVAYKLQFRPSQKCNVPYYKEVFEDRYNCTFPLGMFCDVPDEKGQFNRWLIVDKADSYAPQFPTYYILPCDYVFQYMINGVKQQVVGCMRSQNSYNSGIWTDHVFTSVEDQQKFIVPLNRDTEKIFHDLRMIIDAKILTEPITWHITKIHRLIPNGLVRATLAQIKFDANRDYIEFDNKGNIIGMWADFYSQIPQEPIVVSDSYSIITFSGLKPQIKIGGNYKKFTVTFYNKNQEVIEFQQGAWSFEIKRNPNTPEEIITDCTNLITTLDSQGSTDVEQNQIKLRFDGGNEYLGDILIVTYTSTSNVKSSVEMEIVGL